MSKLFFFFSSFEGEALSQTIFNSKPDITNRGKRGDLMGELGRYFPKQNSRAPALLFLCRVEIGSNN